MDILVIKPPAATIVEKLSSVFGRGVREKVCIYPPVHWMMCRLLWVNVFDELFVCVCVLRIPACP